MDQTYDAISDNIEVVPVVVLSQTFPARAASLPDIRDFVRRCLVQSPLSEQDTHEIGEAASHALLDAAGAAGAISVSFRIFPDHVEVDVLKSGVALTPPAGLDPLTSLLRAHRAAAVSQRPPKTAEAAYPVAAPAGAEPSFADWIGGVLRREGLTMEAAAKQLGVSVKTVSRWVGGATEPRLRDLRRIREQFGEIPLI